MNVNETDDEELALRCAQMYFLQDLSKVEIGEALRVSRFKVARLLSLAREKGLVEIKVQEPSVDTEISARLRSQFGLKDVAIVADAPSLGAVGQAGAAMLSRHLGGYDVLGIGWGRTVHAVVTAMPEIDLPRGVDVVQLSGGIVGPDPAYDPTGLASRAAEILGGKFTPLHAPAFLASAATRRALMAERGIATALDAFENITVALIGVGSLVEGTDSALLAADTLSADARDELARQGAVADVACHFLDVNGRSIGAWEARTLSVSLEDLERARLRIGVAAGANKSAAVLAALRSSTLNALVVDRECARGVIAALSADRD
jgi:DNA-binding transcriptional regulator LsrR (DeoR family)